MPVPFKQVRFRNNAPNPVTLRVEAPIGSLVREQLVGNGALVTVAVGRPDCNDVLLRVDDSVVGHPVRDQTYAIDSSSPPRCFIESVEAHYRYPATEVRIVGRSEHFDPRFLEGD